MSGAGKKGGKFNKTKRGGPRHFTDSDTIDKSVQEIERMRIVAESGSDSDAGSDSDSPAQPIYRNTERAVVNIGKVEELKEDESEFQTANSNRAAPKNMKASDLSSSTGAAPLSRREREALEAERKKAAYWKATLEGKTDAAKSDLARLAIIRKQREEAAKKKAEEAAGKAGATGAKAASLNAGKGIIGKTLGNNK
ncbi:heat- and acid-stable phosphoprotein [Chytriomyces hyalinus]|nr:heat- and acid-stable phosphoprotein [Chytriomyces hyalinus]